MAEPVHTPLGARLRERTQPLAPTDAAHGWSHAHLCEALGVMLKQVAEVYDPDGDVPPLAPILDPTLCPDWALPWLGQLVGVRVPSGLTADEARKMILDVAGFKRGTPAAIEAAVSAVLTGGQTVWFRERDGSAYRLEVVTLASETPDPARALAVLTASIPGGIVLGYRTVEGWDYQQMTTEGGTYAELALAYATYSTLREHEAA